MLYHQALKTLHEILERKLEKIVVVSCAEGVLKKLSYSIIKAV